MVNVLLEFETSGSEFISIHVLNESPDSWIVPEHAVPLVFVVTEVVSIDFEKLTEIFELTETEVSELDGDEEETVGAVVSVWIPVLNPSRVVLSVPILLPAVSLTPSVTLII